MTRESEVFADELEAALGEPLSAGKRRLLADLGFGKKWAAAQTEVERQAVLRAAENFTHRAQAAFGETDREPLGRSRVSNPRTRKVAKDERWPLWRDLIDFRRAADGDVPDEPWEPLRFSLVRDNSARPIRMQRVEISFDWRLPRAALERELAGAWRIMTKKQWVRPGKPLSRQLAALVRFNCLEVPPGMPWRERFERWNAQSAEGDQFDDVRAFERAFRRAELQLTGRKWGLAWFYDDLVRSGRLAKLNTPEGHDLLKKGSRRVIEMYRELYDPSFQQPSEWYQEVLEQLSDEMLERLSAFESKPDEERWRGLRSGMFRTRDAVDWGAEE